MNLSANGNGRSIISLKENKQASRAFLFLQGGPGKPAAFCPPKLSRAPQKIRRHLFTTEYSLSLCISNPTQYLGQDCGMGESIPYGCLGRVPNLPQCPRPACWPPQKCRDFQQRDTSVRKQASSVIHPVSNTDQTTWSTLWKSGSWAGVTRALLANTGNPAIGQQSELSAADDWVLWDHSPSSQTMKRLFSFPSLLTDCHI